MDDKHGEAGKGWYGFGLDGTLAKYDGWKGIDSIGDPVAPMVKLIRRMHDEGKVVKIMTARVAPKETPETKPNPYMAGNWRVQEPDVQTWALKGEWTPLEFIQEWCYRVLGFVPEVVCQKDHLMLELYDDRVKQVIPNEGWLVEDIAAAEHVVRMTERVECACKRYESTGGFMLGMLAMALIVTAVLACLAAAKPVTEAEREPRDYARACVQPKTGGRVDGLLK